MSGRRRDDRLAQLAAGLSDRDQSVVRDVVRLRFLTAGQLARLHFVAIPQPVTRARRVQRDLRRLVRQRLLLRLTRRVGGVRAGSASYTYAATAEGLRLTGYLDGQGIPLARTTHEPGTTFVDHTVAGAEVFVRLIEAARAGRLELLEHQAEPECWRRYLSVSGASLSLRPDAFVALGVGEMEQRSFVEVDRGTEGSTALRRKLHGYLDYHRSGAEQQAHGVFPRVIWQVGNSRRAAVLLALIDELPPAGRTLFAVTTPDDLLAVLVGRPLQTGAAS